MEIVHTKILVACLFCLVRIIFGLLPIKIYKYLKRKGEVNCTTDGQFVNEKRHQQIHCGLALFQAFGGGVIFATCFLHMIPEVYESTIELKKYGLIASHYPFSQLIVSIGFFLVYFIEELAQFFIARVPLVCSRISTPTNKVQPLPEHEVTVIEDISTPVKEIAPPTPEKLNVEEENKKNLDLETNNEFSQVEELDKLMEMKAINQRQIVRGILIVLAISLHSFFEGLAIGMQNSNTNIWYLFLAVSIHSATILFVIGLEMLLGHARIRTIVMHVLILSFTSPLGVFLGLLITLNTDPDNKAKTVGVMFLEGLSAGTILYITFFEVLNREKERRVYRLRRALCIMLGFGLMACLEVGETYY